MTSSPIHRCVPYFGLHEQSRLQLGLATLCIQQADNYLGSVYFYGVITHSTDLLDYFLESVWLVGSSSG